MAHSARDIDILRALEKKVLWLSSWMIHNANHIRENTDGLKVGGHQASSASLATILTALYFKELRPEDRVAVKPHASPVFHAIQYLLGNQTRDKLEAFRAFGGAQSYPSRTKDTDDVDFSTGSVGLGAAQTIFSSLVQDYLIAHDMPGKAPKGRMISLVGDAELDEGNIYEALIEGWKQGLRNTWWIVDYNRQSLDAAVPEGLWEKLETMFANFGWDVVILKHGKTMQAAFAEPGGERLRAWIDACPNLLYSALIFQGGAAFRKRLLDDIGDQGPVTALLDRRSDADLLALMSNLGGHDIECVLDAFQSITHDRPVCFIAYTVKGVGLPFQGHKDNHAGLMSVKQIEAWRSALGVRPGHEWDRFEGLDIAEAELASFLDRVPFNAKGPRRYEAVPIPVPSALTYPRLKEMSTQQGFGLILNDIARSPDPIAARIVTTSPDVTVSTNLGSWVNRRGLFAHEDRTDVFRNEKIPSSYAWSYSPKGQHIELGIAEMNLFLLLSALGLAHAIHGERLLPIGTVYDPFIERGLDALNYACYQDARFMLVATPSGISLAGEGGAHQSIATPLIGMAQDGLASFEPAYADELAEIMRWGFEYMQRNGEAEPDPATWLRDETGGAVYLRLSTRPLAQPQRELTADLKRAIVDGAYWVRAPGAGTEVVIAYAGCLAAEANAAADALAAAGTKTALLAVTSADRLYAGWSAAAKAREAGCATAACHIETLLHPLPANAAIISVLDGHPATLGWLGSVMGHRCRALGVEHFGQSAGLHDLYEKYGLSTGAILAAAKAFARAPRRLAS